MFRRATPEPRIVWAPVLAGVSRWGVAFGLALWVAGSVSGYGAAVSAGVVVAVVGAAGWVAASAVRVVGLLTRPVVKSGRGV